MPFDVFRAHYQTPGGHRIRVLLDWAVLSDFLDNKLARIEIRRGQVALNALREAYAPWYLNEAGDAHWSDKESEAVRFSRIDDYLTKLSEHRQASIATLAEHLLIQGAQEVPLVEVATLDMGALGVLILDGNHRMAAIWKNREESSRPIPVNLVEYRISAPVDPRLLPDLGFHLRNCVPESEGTSVETHAPDRAID